MACLKCLSEFPINAVLNLIGLGWFRLFVLDWFGFVVVFLPNATFLTAVLLDEEIQCCIFVCFSVICHFLHFSNKMNHLQSLNLAIY